jgi:terminase small subunit-like protein
MPRRKVLPLSAYDPDKALGVCEEIAQGLLLKDICKRNGMPSPSTFRRWCVQHPELGRAFQAAIAISAAALEEEALGLAREIRASQKDGTQVRAFEVAIQQFRWSAARRDPAKYGDKSAVSVRVPIQINTTLDLGSEGAGGTLEHPNIYGLEAKVVALPAPEEPPVATPREYSRHGKLILRPRVPGFTPGAMRTPDKRDLERAARDVPDQGGGRGGDGT